MSMPNMPPMGPSPPAAGMSRMDMPMPAMHAAFFWGHRTQVLFPHWPGDHAGVGMYLLCLLVVLALSALVEALSAASRGIARRRQASVLMVSAVHAAKMGMAYLVMLAVMSFNVGVLLAAVGGHAVGFLLARSAALRRATRDDDEPRNSALTPSEAEPKP